MKLHFVYLILIIFISAASSFLTAKLTTEKDQRLAENTQAPESPQKSVNQRRGIWEIYDYEIEYNLLKIINKFSISNDNARKILIDGKKLSFNVATVLADPNLSPAQKKIKLRQLFDTADQYSKSFIAPKSHAQYTQIMEDARKELFK